MFAVDICICLCVCRTVWAYRLLSRTHTETDSERLDPELDPDPGQVEPVKACVRAPFGYTVWIRAARKFFNHAPPWPVPPLDIAYKSPFFIWSIPLPQPSRVESSLIISNSAQSQPNFYIPTILCAFLLPMQSRNFRIFNTHTHSHSHKQNFTSRTRAAPSPPPMGGCCLLR